MTENHELVLGVTLTEGQKRHFVELFKRRGILCIGLFWSDYESLESCCSFLEGRVATLRHHVDDVANVVPSGERYLMLRDACVHFLRSKQWNSLSVSDFMTDLSDILAASNLHAELV